MIARLLTISLCVTTSKSNWLLRLNTLLRLLKRESGNIQSWVLGHMLQTSRSRVLETVRP